MKEEVKNEKKLKQALTLMALGFSSEDVVEEYVSEDGEIKLSKKKITKKSVPPDIEALKMLIDQKNIGAFDNMTDEQLEQEKERLLKILESQNKKEKKCKTKKTTKK